MLLRTSRIPLRVLVVEYDDSAAELLEAILEPETGISVLGRARHGREALTMAAALNPDVVLMDLNMPVMNGVEAIRRLRTLGSSARIVHDRNQRRGDAPGGTRSRRGHSRCETLTS